VEHSQAAKVIAAWLFFWACM